MRSAELAILTLCQCQLQMSIVVLMRLNVRCGCTRTTGERSARSPKYTGERSARSPKYPCPALRSSPLFWASVEVAGKSIDRVRIVLFGVGAANVATYRILKACGLDPKAIVACDSKGILHPGRHNIVRQRLLFADKWRICLESNGDDRTGGPEAAFLAADVCIAFSRPGPGVIYLEWIRMMARDAAVFASANPIPEIFPQAALEAGARIVATGRSDFPNQLNNSPVFPGYFGGSSMGARKPSVTAWPSLPPRSLSQLRAKTGSPRTDYFH